jgi:leucyl aminopeptidase (aminopeptidase T)
VISYQILMATGTGTTSVAEVARRVVCDYLGVRPDESFLVVTDARTSPEIPAALVEAAAGAGARPVHAVIPVPSRSGEEPAPPVAAAMAAADACLCAASRSLYHTAAKGAAQAAGTRGLFNAPSAADAWSHGAMTADFLALRAVAERLAARLRGAETVRATSPAGTDLSVSVGGREPKGWLTGVCRNPGEVSALPGGEVSFPPLEGSANGTVVVERVMTDLGALGEPIVWHVRDGHAVRIDGGAEADRLRRLIDGVENATNIAELGIGLNPAARVGGDITEAKKRAGTAHVALGDNAGGYGGVVESPVHLDGLVLDVTIEIDGEPVVADGELVF